MLNHEPLACPGLKHPETILADRALGNAPVLSLQGTALLHSHYHSLYRMAGSTLHSKISKSLLNLSK